MLQLVIESSKPGEAMVKQIEKLGLPTAQIDFWYEISGII